MRTLWLMYNDFDTDNWIIRTMSHSTFQKYNSFNKHSSFNPEFLFHLFSDLVKMIILFFLLTFFTSALADNPVDDTNNLVRFIYTFSLSFSSSFAFQTGKFTSSYICNSNDKWNDISNDWMLSVQMPFRCISKEIGAKDTSHCK